MLFCGYCVLADREYLVDEKLPTVDVLLRIPAVLKENRQLTATEVDISRLVAHVRIHVKSLIRRLKKIKILSHIVLIPHE